MKILDRIKPVILTSATVSANGRCEFLKKRLGIDGDAAELILDSPFDYSRNALLYIPDHIPEPAAQPQRYQQSAIDEMKKILSLMGGRTFILFTSFSMMDKAYRELKEGFGNLQFLKQGDAPRYKLLETFKRTDTCVLLGTNTFWQGIDVPGRALECVVIAKLPFAVPDEPIIEARMEFLLAQGKDPFVHYQLPQAVLMLRQGFGRLIRTHQDRGMVAILDPRVKTKSYGKNFLTALPRCRRISDLREAEKFFAPLFHIQNVP